MGDLRSAEASFRSPYGLIRSEWTTEQGGFDLLVEVPANTTARIYVPAPAGSRVCESGLEVAQCKDVESLGTEDGYREMFIRDRLRSVIESPHSQLPMPEIIT